ncbi:hypothetical protein PMIN06_006766 [Paraphaeosphaeria minitans]|uniref:endo-1,3(4)-beta-glucanase n=1 Tax=Paraphaeosphaeria minitans TaxID=565426 RepID=A0A9P6GHW8_9PLEO|nr:putative endo-1,3(4)-beta-glucanase [Paraphaeosphaeria minitans]
MYFSTIVSTAAFAVPALAGYVLQDDYMTDFYGHFNFFDQGDPTHGFVKYVDEATARSSGLIDASGPPVPVKWGVDTVNQDPEGRASVRLESKTAYNKGLVVIDLEHMPFGCGTWPAFWMFGPNWPYQGEIDILEGVHEQDTNALTLHTSTGCSIGSDTSLFSGSVETQNCDVKAAGQADNAGCSIKSKDNKSYGAGLNDNGGGVYATEWTSDAISIWFFPRDSVPEGVTGDNPDPSTWGTPSAKWVQESCDIDGIFKDLNIIFDTTFCGDWAGNTWSSSSCASKAPTCNDYVRDNPDAFTNAFWTVNALKVYQQGDAPAAAPVESQAPVGEQPSPTEAPVEQPSLIDVPVDGPVSSDAPVPNETDPATEPAGPVDSSPPIIEQSSTAADIPLATDAPIQQNPDGTLNIPLGSWGTNGEGGGNDGAEDTPGAETEPSPAAPISTPATGVSPSILPTPGNGGGFNWPGAPQGTGVPSSGLAAVPPFPASNQTGYPVLPTGTGSGNIAEVWETIYTTQVVTVPGVGPAPTDAPTGGDGDGSEPIATVQETVQQTEYITVTWFGAQPSAPAASMARMVRRGREIGKRMAHHHRL